MAAKKKGAARRAKKAGQRRAVPRPVPKPARAKAVPKPARAKAVPKPARAKVARRPANRTSEASFEPFVGRRTPQTLRLRSVGPSFTVADVEKSLAFYRDVLGFVVKERYEQDGVLTGVELAAGTASFWLGQDDWQKGRDRVKGQGFRIYCTTTQDVDALAARVQATGVALYEELADQPWGGRDFTVKDPDGFIVSIGRI